MNDELCVDAEAIFAASTKVNSKKRERQKCSTKT